MTSEETISVKQYFDQRMAELDKYYNQRLSDMDRRLQTVFDLNDRALKAALERNDARLEVMNNMRKQLDIQEGEFVRRTTLDAQLAAFSEKIDALRISKAMLEGRASMSSVYISYVFTFIGISIALIGLLIKMR